MNPRKTARANSLSHKLAAYSATAGAALLTAPAANASLQFITSFSLDHGSTFSTTAPDVVLGASQLKVQNFTAATASHQAAFKGKFHLQNSLGRNFVSLGAAGNGPFTAVGGHVARSQVKHSHRYYEVAVNFSPAAAIAGQSFGGAYLALKNATTHHGGFVPAGPGATATGYIGFKTSLRGHLYYGWMHVKVSENANGLIDEVAFEPVSGDPGVYGAFDLAGNNVTAGEAPAPVPEPINAALGGLGLLAIGAAGVRELRRRRAAAVENG